MSYWKSEIIENDPGQRIRCRGVIDSTLEVFQDHFPEFPVLPGVLALDILKEAVDLCQASVSASKNTGSILASVKAVKFQHFLRPGESWESQATLAASGSQSVWKVQLSVRNQPAVSARMCFNHDVSVREV